MNDTQITELLSKLADKFGTTAEHLWGVLLRQAYIEAATDFSTTLLMVGALVFFCKLMLKKIDNESFRDEGIFFAWLGMVFFAAFTLVTVIFSIIDITNCLANPEYWALTEILSHVR